MKRLMFVMLMALVVFTLSCPSSDADMLTGYAAASLGLIQLTSSAPALQFGGDELSSQSSGVSAYASDLGGQNGSGAASGTVNASVSTAYGNAQETFVPVSPNESSFGITISTSPSMNAAAGINVPPQRDATAGGSAYAIFNYTDLVVTSPTNLTLSVPYSLYVNEPVYPTAVNQYFRQQLVTAYVTLSLDTAGAPDTHNWVTMILTENNGVVTLQYSGHYDPAQGFNYVSNVDGSQPLSGVLTLTLPDVTSHRIDFDVYVDTEVRYAAVPIPPSLVLLGSGLIGLAGFRKRFMKR